MRARLDSQSDPIYVLPPHEMLSTQLKTTRAGPFVHTSVAWLGHGAMFPRSIAVDFLALMQHLNMTDDEQKMGDNYFAIMRNVVPEAWFDQGIEFGGGQAFTVGTEGNERNRKHFVSLYYFFLSLSHKLVDKSD